MSSLPDLQVQYQPYPEEEIGAAQNKSFPVPRGVLEFQDGVRLTSMRETSYEFHRIPLRHPAREVRKPHPRSLKNLLSASQRGWD
jgi:hypothetical protein